MGRQRLETDTDRKIRYINSVKYRAYKESQDKTVDLSLHKNNAEYSIAQARKAKREAFAESAPSIFKVILIMLLFFGILGYYFSRGADADHRLDFLDKLNTEWLLNTLAEAPEVDFFWFQNDNEFFEIGDYWIIDFGPLGNISFDWLRVPVKFIFDYFLKPLFFIFTGVYQVINFIIFFLTKFIPYLAT